MPPIQVSPETASKILKLIRWHLDENGLAKNQAARWLAIGLAADMKRLMYEEYNGAK